MRPNLLFDSHQPGREHGTLIDRTLQRIDIGDLGRLMLPGGVVLKLEEQHELSLETRAVLFDQ